MNQGTMPNRPRQGDGVADAQVEQRLRAQVAQAPDSYVAHAELASFLCRLRRADEALALLDDAVARYSGAVWPLSIRAAVLSAEQRAQEAVGAHRAVVALAPQAAIPWINYGHALKIVGETGDAIAAYRKALALEPTNGSAWWGLADLRTFRFSAADVAAMLRATSIGPNSPLQDVHLHFALGRGLGDLGDYERSFSHYEKANRLRGELAPYDAASTSATVDRFSPLLVSTPVTAREAKGCDAADPIFIVGMPRSGSTLVEQILASHPLIEGAGELSELSTIAAGLEARAGNGTGSAVAMPLSDEDLQRIGEEYLHACRRHRRTDRPFFTDKMPSNWQFVPLILRTLPNAKIIDVRRHPAACCLSSFMTYFNLATNFPTTLAELAHYHGIYTHLMAQVDAAFPGSILRVDYERLVHDSEAEIRRLLDGLALPFDPECLRFYANRRDVHTPSAQQVRQPIYRSSLDYWRNYEPMLTPHFENACGLRP